MTKQLGPTFGSELDAAGILTLPISWGATDDTIQGRENITTAQNATLDGVIAAHDPTKPYIPPPENEHLVLYDHENRVRSLEGQPPLTLGDFLTRTKLAKHAVTPGTP
jgi:hypothetical protein